MNTERYRVLLIEDAQNDAVCLGRLLRSMENGPTEIEHCDHIASSLKRLESHSYDIILLDLNLSDSNELEGYRRIQSVASKTPIIVIIQRDMIDFGVRALHENAQDYLIKQDIDAKLLKHSIRHAIERKQVENALRASEQRYALAIAGANDGIWDWDIENQATYFSPRWKAIMGLAEQSGADSIDAWLERLHSEDRDEFKKAMYAHLKGNTPHLEHECRIVTAENEIRWILVRGLAVYDQEGIAKRIAGSISDVTSRKHTEAQVLRYALHDSLTRLPNRVLFMDRLQLALHHYKRNRERLFAMLFIDLDRFKNVNDSLGHAVGDQLLAQIAAQLKQCLRAGDTLARLGGDEFAILLDDIKGLDDAIYVANRIREVFKREFVIDRHTIYTSASIGIALSAPNYQAIEEILHDADQAMYRAKGISGDTQYIIFDHSMREQVVSAHDLETDLFHALQRDEFLLHYQPIVSLQTMEVQSFEALLRWRHPQRGLLYPDDFISIAERTGLIVPIGWWVIEEACKQISYWQNVIQSALPLSISVNVSGKHFIDDEIELRLSQMIRQWRINPASLCLEITENTVIDHGDIVLDTLSKVRSLGIELAVDDFGTGYSSLSYLQRFRYDSLKIDRSFVESISTKVGSSAIVEAIVNLGYTLGIKVVAEGVETKEQLTRLRAMKCPEVQGYWFSKPLDQETVTAYLSKGIRRYETIGH